jgi:hypothetical protein
LNPLVVTGPNDSGKVRELCSKWHFILISLFVLIMVGEFFRVCWHIRCRLCVPAMYAEDEVIWGWGDWFAWSASPPLQHPHILNELMNLSDWLFFWNCYANLNNSRDWRVEYCIAQNWSKTHAYVCFDSWLVFECCPACMP